MNIEFVKCFDSGIVVGVFVLFINVLVEEYGEGSFIKGFFILVLFDLFVLKLVMGCGIFFWILIVWDGG